MHVTLAKGHIYIPREICESYLADIEGVVLQRDGHDLLVLPVRHAPAGGYLLKQRNIRGDRAVSAADFFRFHSLDEEGEQQSAVRWDEARAALVINDIFG